MADKTQIEWTDATWNPVTGCTKVSPGCAHCYAESVDHRFDHDKVGKLPWAIPASQGGRGVTLHPERLDVPVRWKRSRRIFVNSMSDLFHPDVPDDFIGAVFQVMANTPRHTYQLLTKRPERMTRLLNGGWCWACGSGACECNDPTPSIHFGLLDTKPLPNAWLGVSVENQHWADIRIPLLLQTPAAVRFVSYEPALKPVDFRRWLNPLWGVDGFTKRAISQGMFNSDQVDSMSRPTLSQIIIGGESGPYARPCAWPLEGEIEQPLGFGRTPLQGGIEQVIRSTLAQAQAAKVAVFVKQMGSVWAIHHAHGWECGEYYTTYSVRQTYRPDRKGGDMEHWPEDLRVQQYPTIVEAVTA